MKSSTLHRSNLSREKMLMIENVRPQNYGNSGSDSNQNSRFQKRSELDVLWRDFEKNVQTRSRSKAPMVYGTVGFILGVFITSCIALIIGVSTYSEIKKSDFSDKKSDNVSVISPVNNDEIGQNSSMEEKYTVKSGDTLDKIAYRFYGKYDPVKIDRIMKLNNIKDATTIQIGQVLIIPLN